MNKDTFQELLALVGWVESMLDLSRHVEIDLERFRPGFRPARLMEFGLI